jgi:hypothetical protein
MAINFNWDPIDPDPAHLNGTMDIEVLDADQNPNQVLQTDLAWNINVKWSIFGTDAPAIGGDWHVQATLESIGPGPELIVGTADVPVSAAAPALTRDYAATINVPVGKLKSDGTEDGVYLLSVLITHTNTGAGVTKKDKMAGFSEGPMLHFYTPEV